MEQPADCLTAVIDQNSHGQPRVFASWIPLCRTQEWHDTPEGTFEVALQTMNPNMMQKLENRRLHETKGRMQVVMLYEDVGMGKVGRGLLESIQAQLEEVAGFDYGLWRLDALELSSFNTHIAVEAAEADLVVLSLRLPVLSHNLRTWLEGWLAQCNADAALVVLYDGGYRWEQAATIKRQLEDMGGAYRVTVFIEPVTVDEMAPLPQTPAEDVPIFRVQSAPGRIGGTSNSVEEGAWAFNPYNWGLNE